MNYAVIGGGVSGMSACYYLRMKGHQSILFEKDNILGGRLGVGHLGDKKIQFGGKNIGQKYSEFRAFCESMEKVSYEYFGINTSRVDNGTLVTLDRKKPWKTVYNLLCKNNPVDLVRFVLYAYHTKINQQDGFIDSDYFDSIARKHGNCNLSKLFSDSFCNNIIRPMVVRMNGAEANEAYIANFGSNLRVLMDSYDQLVDGIQPILDKFLREYQVSLSTTVKRILVDQNKNIMGVEVTAEDGTLEKINTDGVIVALPASSASRLLNVNFPHSDVLSRVKYNAVKVIVAKYRRDIFTADVRAIVFDDSHIISNAGVYGLNSLDTIRFTFSGLRAREHLKNNPSDAKLLLEAESILNKHMPVSIDDRVEYASLMFEHGLCSFGSNQKDILKSLSHAYGSYKGMYFTGDYFKGASIEACFRASKHCIDLISSNIYKNT